jgi:hypothetical protein
MKNVGAQTRLTDEHLEGRMKIATEIRADIERLLKQKQR